jgi:hypothetical protein
VQNQPKEAQCFRNNILLQKRRIFKVQHSVKQATWAARSVKCAPLSFTLLVLYKAIGSVKIAPPSFTQLVRSTKNATIAIGSVNFCSTELHPIGVVQNN